MDVFRAQDRASKAFATQDGFDNFVSRLGLNNDNTLSAGTYEFNLITRNRIQLEAAYRGSWIVGVVIDAVAEDMTRAGVDITTTEADADIPKIRNQMTKLQIWQSLATLVKWGRLYGGAIGVIQIEGQDLATELDLDTVGKNQFKGIVVYDRWQLNPDLTRVIETGPETGLPKYYQIVNNAAQVQPTNPTPTGQQTVHHSRCIRYTGVDLPFFQAITEMMWGESVLERLWDRLISFDNASLSAGSLIDRANLRMVGIDGLRDIIGAGGEEMKGLLSQFEMMRSLQVNEGITLLDKNDAFETVSYSFAGLSDMLLQFGQQLSGACGIPLVRLFCQSPAGLNATGDADLRMYYDNINSQQESKLRNGMDILLKVLWRSTLGKAAPEDLEFEFTALWQMSETDKATNAKTTTETVIGAVESGVVSRKTGLVELRDSSSNTGIFSNITDEEINEAEDDPVPMPDADPVAPGDPTSGGAVKPPAEPVKALDGFQENKHPRKDDGKFGSGAGGGSHAEKIAAAHAKMKKLKKDAASARSRADSAPDRHDKNPKSLQTANQKIKEYNQAAHEYNALLDSKTKDSSWLRRLTSWRSAS